MYIFWPTQQTFKCDASCTRYNFHFLPNKFGRKLENIIKQVIAFEGNLKKLN